MKITNGFFFDAVKERTAIYKIGKVKKPDFHY